MAERYRRHHPEYRGGSRERSDAERGYYSEQVAGPSRRYGRGNVDWDRDYDDPQGVFDDYYGTGVRGYDDRWRGPRYEEWRGRHERGWGRDIDRREQDERYWREGQEEERGSGGGGRFYGHGPKGYTRSDERIREDVCERLTYDPDIDASDVSVQVQNGEVTLEGGVEDRKTKRLAEDLAEEIHGVKEVHNRLHAKKGIFGSMLERVERVTSEAGEHRLKQYS